MYGKRGDVENYPICFWDLADELRRDVPEIEVVSRLYRSNLLVSVKENSENINFGMYMVDSCFMSIFDFDVVYGETKNALEAPNQCVITRSTAESLFGAGVNPVSSPQVTADGTTYRVVAVIGDLPENTHLKFDILIQLPNFGWGGLEYFTYLKMCPGVDRKATMAKCDAINAKMLETRFGGEGKRFGSITEPLTELLLLRKHRLTLRRRRIRGISFLLCWWWFLFLG